MSEKSEWAIYIDGKEVTKRQLISAWHFWNEFHIIGNETQCPLCGCELMDNGLFVCRECCEIIPINELCSKHNGNFKICQNCCEKCIDEKSYQEMINSQSDQRQGK